MREAGAVSEKCDCAALALSCFRLDVDFKAFFILLSRFHFSCFRLLLVTSQYLLQCGWFLFSPSALTHGGSGGCIWGWGLCFLVTGPSGTLPDGVFTWTLLPWRASKSQTHLASFAQPAITAPPLLKADSVGEISYYLTCKEQKNKQKMHCTCQGFLATLRHKFAKVIVST